MIRRSGLLHSLFLLVAAALLAAGPGSSLCIAAARTPGAAEPSGMTMAGCHPSDPAGKKAGPAHPDCTSPCIGMTCREAGLAPAPIAKALPPDATAPRLDGVDPVPEVEPPRA